MYFLLLVALIVFALTMGGCTPLVSEFSDSSGCLYSTGGPIPGMASGIVIVCRSGKEGVGATVTYEDNDGRKIRINHSPIKH